jgi:transcriptional/translational regulatory protein YebC/TACO1
MESALDAGAHDVVINEDGSIEVRTTLETFGPTQDALKAAGLVPEQADMTMIASTEVELDLDGAEKMLKLVEHLEDLDDVQNVYSNANISDEIAEQL